MVGGLRSLTGGAGQQSTLTGLRLGLVGRVGPARPEHVSRIRATTLQAWATAELWPVGVAHGGQRGGVHGPPRGSRWTSPPPPSPLRRTVHLAHRVARGHSCSPASSIAPSIDGKHTRRHSTVARRGSKGSLRLHGLKTNPTRGQRWLVGTPEAGVGFMAEWRPTANAGVLG